MRSGYHLTRDEKIRIWNMYADGASINAVAERMQVSRKTVAHITMGIRRKSSGWREGLCACGPNGFSPVQQQLERIKLLDMAKRGEPIALRRLNAMGLTRWERQGEVIMGACHV
jgi:hypothetical protein